MFNKSNFLFLIVFIFAAEFCTAQELNNIQLPKPQTEMGKPLMQCLSLRQSRRNFDTKDLPLQEIANILWAANGINRPESGKRTSPSARNWQEIDVYVVLERGAFIYDATKNELSPVAPGDLRALCGVQEFVKSAPVNLVYVSNFDRIKSNDDEETKLMWTSAAAGFCVQNVYLYCASQNFACVVRGLVDKAKLANALRLNPNQKIILTQTVGYSK